MSVIVSLGVDCGVANFLKENGYRNFSLPFDWVVSYGGVSDIINSEFTNYINDESVKFLHHRFPQDIEKIKRRSERFLNLLNGEDEIIFLRKGHSDHHHRESTHIKDDLIDCEKLYDILKKKYKKLKFKIILFLVCSECYDHNRQYNSDKIIIYNVSDKNNRSNLIKNNFLDFEKQTGIKKNLEQSFVDLNL